MDLLDYLIASGNANERFDFDNHDDAHDFGQRLRENIAAEGYSDCIEVKISAVTVRVYVNEAACLNA